MGELTIHRLSRLTAMKLGDIDRLPFSIKILLESCLRNTDNFEVTEQDVRRLAAWKPRQHGCGRTSLQAGARDPAGFHRRALRGRSGVDARGDEAGRR